MSVPETARAVIIGGGVIGCSVAYHLAQLGWRDVVLLERKQLTSGTTWHAAGLIAQLRASANMTRLAKYSADLYARLESETGLATGMRQTGSITVALTEARVEELRRQAGMARAFGVEISELAPDEIAARYPHLNTDGVRMGVWLPGDGQGDPSNIALALAAGARAGGARIVEQTRVTGIDRVGRHVRAVRYDGPDGPGRITAEHVVNCAGMWAREVGAMAGATVPLHAAEHFYIVTEPVAGLGRLPVLRVPDECAYYKEDAGKLMLGAFEPRAKPWGMEGIPESFCFDELPEDLDHFAPILERAVERIPMLAQAGIRTFFNGPESFTPDNAYLLGRCNEADNLWVAAGFNSVGIQSAGGAGMALAQWMQDGVQPFDLGDVDVARAQPFQRNRRYLRDRVSETLGLLYADHTPFRQKATARGVRRSPLHDHLLARGAVMGELAGWERANWFAAPGGVAAYDIGWGRRPWFPNWAAEHAALREGIGLYDMSSFGKIRVEGADAAAFLDLVCANRIDVPVGRVVYTQMLNSRGGIEADVTVTRLSDTAFLVVTPAARLHADMAWLRRHLGDARAIIVDVTAGEAVICVMGPGVRGLMAAVSPDDWSDAAQPFGTAREVEIGIGLARAHRVSFVGALGYELYVSADMAAHVFETLAAAGADHGLALCGLHAMDSCRMERGFRHFGHDITPEDSPLEAGLGFAVPKDKTGFIGCDAVARQRDEGIRRRMVALRLDDPAPMLFHNEPVLKDGRVVGHVTSGSYGHHVGAALGLAYLPSELSNPAALAEGGFAVEVAGQVVPATVQRRAFFDPDGIAMRGDLPRAP